MGPVTIFVLFVFAFVVLYWMYASIKAASCRDSTGPFRVNITMEHYQKTIDAEEKADNIKKSFKWFALVLIVAFILESQL